jgi:hypothetical protein
MGRGGRHVIHTVDVLLARIDNYTEAKVESQRKAHGNRVAEYEAKKAKWEKSSGQRKVLDFLTTLHAEVTAGGTISYQDRSRLGDLVNGWPGQPPGEFKASKEKLPDGLRNLRKFLVDAKKDGNNTVSTSVLKEMGFMESLRILNRSGA